MQRLSRLGHVFNPLKLSNTIHKSNLQCKKFNQCKPFHTLNRPPFSNRNETSKRCESKERDKCKVNETSKPKTVLGHKSKMSLILCFVWILFSICFRLKTGNFVYTLSTPIVYGSFAMGGEFFGSLVSCQY